MNPFRDIYEYFYPLRLPDFRAYLGTGLDLHAVYLVRHIIKTHELEDSDESIVPVGYIARFSDPTAPKGWAICDGSLPPKGASPKLPDILRKQRKLFGGPW